MNIALPDSTEGSGTVSATCGVSTYDYDISGESVFYTTIESYFVFKHAASNETNPSVEIFKDDSSIGFSTLSIYNWRNVSLGKLNAGDYVFSIKSNGKEVCSHSIEVQSPLSCSVDKTTVGIGEEFTFTANYAGSCYNTSFTGSGVSHNNCQTNYTITPTAVGTHTYTFSVTGGSLGAAECSYDVIVTEMAPQITCPENQTGVGLNSNVSVTPQSLTGCGNGCNYTIEGTSATGSGYTGGALSFTGESTAGEYTYTFNVSNSAGSDECTFTVAYEEGGSVGETCECSSYCDDCSNIKTSSGTYNENAYNCIFFESVSKLNIGGNATKINGVSVTNSNSCYDASTCESNLNNLGITKVNGGYYMSLPNYNYIDMTISGSVPNACSGSGGGSGDTPQSSSSAVVSSSSGSDSDSYESATMGTLYSGPKNIQYETTSGTCQIEASVSNSWSEWVKQGNVFNNWGSGGQISIISPLKVSIPSGATFKITNCW